MNLSWLNVLELNNKMVGFGDVIPDELLRPYKLEEFINWLVQLPIDIQTKKYMLMYWCKVTGVKLTKELVDRVTMGKSHLTRG